MKVYFSKERPGELYFNPLAAVDAWPQVIYKADANPSKLLRTGLFSYDGELLSPPVRVSVSRLLGPHADKAEHAIEARMCLSPFMERNLVRTSKNGTWETLRSMVSLGYGGFIAVVLSESYGQGTLQTSVPFFNPLYLNQSQHAILGWVFRRPEWAREWTELVRLNLKRSPRGTGAYFGYGWDFKLGQQRPFAESKKELFR